MENPILDALLSIDKDLFLKLHESITADEVFRYLKPIADSCSPYQTATWTRALEIENLLNIDGTADKENFKMIRNFQNTGNSVILIGKNETKKQVWLLAHLDQISYLIEDYIDGKFQLMPICYHLMEPGERAGVVVAYNFDKNIYEVVDHGKILTTDAKEVLYEPGENKQLHTGMRVCFESHLDWNKSNNEVVGSLDDAAGVAAIVLAAKFLANYDIEILVGLTDEEEGVAGTGNQTIGLGGSRLFRYFDQPELVIASDIHEAADMYGGGAPYNMKPGDGASFAEKSAKGMGAVIPPHLYELMLRMSRELESKDVKMKENLGGYISRTEDINAMYRLPNIALLGFLGKNRHFQKGFESANILDLVNLAKSIVCFVLLTETKIWKDLGKI